MNPWTVTGSAPTPHAVEALWYCNFKVNPRELDHGFRMTSAGIPSTLPQGHENNDVLTFGFYCRGSGFRFSSLSNEFAKLRAQPAMAG